MKAVELSDDLPGADLVRRGIRDLVEAQRTVPGCLLACMSERMRDFGLLPPSVEVPWAEPERELYALLLANGDDAYSRYNALRRELDSFAAAMERRSRRRREAAP
ncbi:MAG TPA: hypothetical protein VK993_02705 [Chthoniobacterales bacterium]|nr:hypothetical protein [Chthoniobacterales bacterium]